MSGTRPGALGAPRLRRLLHRGDATAPPASHPPHCDLCAEPLAPEHRHLLELPSRSLHCACRACAILFDRQESGAGHYRLVPERLWWLQDLALGEEDWRRLGVPVGTAFVTPRSASAPVACYPSPLGMTESRLDDDAWQRVATAHPALATLEPDVEALLVHRRRGFEGHWIASLETCLRLVACVRSHWRGLAGGERVWREIAAFFDALQRDAVAVSRADLKRRERIAAERSP